MRFPAYPKYKPTGVEWLGNVPEHWEVKRLKYSASINDEALPETTSPDFELAYVDIGSVDESAGIIAVEEMVFEEAPSRARRVARDGDTIVSTVRTYLRAIAPVRAPKENLIVSTGFAVIRPRAIEPGFLSYALRESGFVDAVVARSVGVSYPAVNATEVGTIPVPLPSDTEQRAIADFLDAQTTKLDTLVAKKRALIEKLKEKRTALISRAVTRGLPPDAARAAGLEAHLNVKASGIAWLGDVPKHWEACRLKHILLRRRGAIKTGPFGSQLQSADMLDGEIKVYNQRSVLDRDLDGGDNYISLEKFDELRPFEVFPGDLLVTTRGTIGRCTVVPEGAERGILHPCLMRIQVDESRTSTRFIEILIQDSGRVLEQLRVMSNATTIDVIYSESLKEVWIAVPPLSEQRTLTAYVEREITKVDQMIVKVETAIERLVEYRTALITAAVTGKIDVRDAAA